MSAQALERRLLIVDDKITEQGRNFYEQIISLKEGGSPIEIKKVNDIMKDQFEELYAEFPRNDTFSYKGKSFQGSRALRTGKKDDVKTKYWKILAEGVHTHQQVLNALKAEVLQKKEQSVKTGENKLSYMQSLSTWMNQRSYENFLNIEQSTPEEKKEMVNPKDLF